ncbi:uncharacterized protein KY384_008888 [Bacidia gigantensis]|uniref:uncharacterized protein n=1 Tax=Bacidia gigantensis TaxID=2732470 RepID=UPI001D03D46B|nr:uncharacterized protein KY384_008888 [Bacidia gigantensis]KAG8525244.1 hypothetical protein KY384_008888 [Bacidia gigantensis]
MHRIRAACEGQLKWAFQIAAPLDRWDDYQAVDGAPESNDGESRREVTSKSNPIDVSCQFLKLSLYFHSWRDKWPFVLKLLHLRMDNWLSYLVSSRHMNNLWVEREDVESWKVKDTTSHDSAYVYGKHPRYHLSDSALLWLALLQLEKLIGLIENEIQLSNGQFEENTEIMIKDVRRDFNKHREALNLRRLRSDILKTHGISVGELGTSTVQEVLALTGAGATGVSASGTHRANDFSEQTQSQSDPTTTGKANIQAAKPDERVQKVIALERGIKELTFEIKAYDNATIEAVVFGIFDGPQDKAGEAWLNTMKLQQNKDIETIDDPCHLALASWASNFNYAICKSNGSSVTDAAYLRLSNALFDSGAFARDIKADRLEQTRAWSSSPYSDNQQSERRQSANVLLTGSQKLPLPLASSESKFESRTVAPVVVIPEMLDTASSKDSQNAINTNFLPSWMYHYPDFIHNDTLVIDISKELEQLGYVESLRSAITAWRDQKEFNLDGYWDLPFAPSVIDSGIKKPTSSGDGLAERQIVIDHCWYGWSLQKRLLQSRTIDQAKKRLIELPSQSKESLLVCWLTASDQEKPFLLDFIRRHEMAENFFGERAHMLGNIWETEFHIGFYQLVDVERGDYPNDAVPLHGQSSRTRRMPTLTTTSHRHEIMPVAISFRFAGDLRDRFWTCHFLSSVATISGFRGLAEEHDRSMDSTEDFYKEKQGQRKILELVYVERALGEMKRSIDGLLAAFQKELAVPETRDPQGESFEFIYGYSSLHLKAGEILRDILSQLNMSINAISEWERREETRGFRSRWSEKDEERHGERLKDLSRKCKLNLQQLRVQQSRLQEQRGFVEQRHNNLVSYMQLREARTSTRSAEDVRLFTYVTIIFLPLSFSSSLFSMQGAPAGHTISIMAPTTIIALAATVLLLSNMKLLDRNWSFWMNRLHTDARKRMKASKHSWAVPWNKVSRELDEAAQRRLTKSDYERRLPAESKWWYFLFWAFYAAKVPRTLVMEGYTAWLTYPGFSSNRLILICRILAALLFAPICALIFICQVLLTVGYDTCNFLATMVLWVLSPRQDEKNAATQWKKNFRSRRRQARIERHAEGKDEKDRKEEKGNEVPKRSDTATTTARPSRVQDGLEKVTDWLISPPRPIRGHTAKWRPRKPDAANAGSDSAGSSSDESDDVSSFYSHELNSDDDDNWNGKAETQQQTDETGNGGEGEEDSSPPEAKELQREMNGAELEDSPKRRRWRGMFKKEKPEERV